MAGRKGKIVLVTLALLIVAVAVFRKPLLKATMPVVEDVTLAEFVIRNDSAFVKLSMIIRNKAVWHIELKQVRLGVYDDTLQILSYVNDTMKVLARNQVKKEDLYCTIPFRKVLQRIREHQGQDTVGLVLKGELVYSTFLGEMSTVVERRIPVQVPIPPRLAISGIQYNGKTDGFYNLLFDLSIKNENAREMDLKDLSYDLRGGDYIHLFGKLQNVVIAAKDSTRIRVPALMQVDHQFALISKILLDKDKMPYSFVMKGTIQSFTGIVKNDVPITVTSFGQMELYNEEKKKADRPKITLRKKRR